MKINDPSEILAILEMGKGQRDRREEMDVSAEKGEFVIDRLNSQFETHLCQVETGIKMMEMFGCEGRIDFEKLRDEILSNPNLKLNTKYRLMIEDKRSDQ